MVTFLARRASSRSTHHRTTSDAQHISHRDRDAPNTFPQLLCQIRTGVWRVPRREQLRFQGTVYHAYVGLVTSDRPAARPGALEIFATGRSTGPTESHVGLGPSGGMRASTKITP